MEIYMIYDMILNLCDMLYIKGPYMYNMLTYITYLVYINYVV